MILHKWLYRHFQICEISWSYTTVRNTNKWHTIIWWAPVTMSGFFKRGINVTACVFKQNINVMACVCQMYEGSRLTGPLPHLVLSSCLFRLLLLKPWSWLGNLGCVTKHDWIIQGTQQSMTELPRYIIKHDQVTWGTSKKMIR